MLLKCLSVVLLGVHENGAGTHCRCAINRHFELSFAQKKRLTK